MAMDCPGGGTLAAAAQSCSEMNHAEMQTIAALQTSGDPSTAAVSLRCLRFNNPVNGAEHLSSHACSEGSGPKIEIVPLAVFPGKRATWANMPSKGPTIRTHGRAVPLQLGQRFTKPLCNWQTAPYPPTGWPMGQAAYGSLLTILTARACF